VRRRCPTRPAQGREHRIHSALKAIQRHLTLRTSFQVFCNYIDFPFRQRAEVKIEQLLIGRTVGLHVVVSRW
jgi:hypothetical protein